jgi:uncharacterized protein (DUF983 family)
MTETSTPDTLATTRRELATAMGRGAMSKCPNCGKGRLFIGFLRVAPECDACGEHFHHHRADDAPAYLTILIVGHLMLPFILGIEEVFEPAMWVHLVLWGTLIPAACLALLRPMKGAVVGMQWASRMHGFGEGKAGSDA